MSVAEFDASTGRIADLNKGGTRFTSKYSSRSKRFANIATRMTGTPWKVDYYHQLLGEDEDPTHFSETLDATNQSYEVVANFTLLVTDPLGQSVGENGSSTVTGTANMYGYIVPAIGDLFMTTLIDGGTGLFDITEVEAFTYSNRTNYKISYQLLYEL